MVTVSFRYKFDRVESCAALQVLALNVACVRYGGLAWPILCSLSESSSIEWIVRQRTELNRNEMETL